jgi:thioredoxin-dependent peroxiredoxin
MDTRSRWAGFLILAASVAWTLPARAQAQADTTSPAVGAEAPDFSLPGATRYGLLKDPVRLSDYRGQTVVLAFFFKARTKG